MIGNAKLSSLVNVFEEQIVGQDKEAFCGYEEEMLTVDLQIYGDEQYAASLTDDYPIKGKYARIENIETEIHMVINYYDHLFLNDQVDFRDNLSDFRIMDN